MGTVSDIIWRENRNSHFMFNNFVCRQYWLLWDNVGNYCRGAGQAPDDNVAHAHCMLDH